MHVLAEQIEATRHSLDQVLSGTNGPFQYVTDGGVQKRLLIREVPVKGCYANPCAVGHSVARGLAANFHNQLNGHLDQSLPIFLGIRSHLETSP